MIPAPPPSTAKPVAFVDTEMYPNYWLLLIRPQGGQVVRFALRAGECFDEAAAARIRYLLGLFTLITFNGIYYDMPMIGAAIGGYNCEQLKWVSDSIIVKQIKHWELGIPEFRPDDHIDIMEVLPGAGSQKQYAGRIHCKTMRDLPYEPDAYLTEAQIAEVESYCENDLSVLEDLYTAVQPQLNMRVRMGAKYGLDLRSKSDAQMGEAIIKSECEKILGQRIYKAEVDWNLKFRYQPPAYLSFQTPEMIGVFAAVKEAIFTIGPSGAVVMPPQLEGLEVALGKVTYRMGIGGLHSKDKRSVYRSDADHVLIEIDVASYYPNLILNSEKWPASLGPTFRVVYKDLKDNRLKDKNLEKKLKKAGDTTSPAAIQAHNDNEGGKVSINGPFGKLNNFYSVLRAPEMFIQTTVSGQLSLLMLIEWMELQGVEVISANTDGLLLRCPRPQVGNARAIIMHWELSTGLEMEETEYATIYRRDVSNYFAIKTSGEVKRKGEYSTAGLVEKKNPDVEICADAVSSFLSKGTPILYSLAACRDIRKFVTIQKVTGGAVKLWGEGPSKDTPVKDMGPRLLAHGWRFEGRRWHHGELALKARDAYRFCFPPQQPEYLGKVVRWYYSVNAPGPIIYNDSGNQVSLSYGAKPCMTLPDEFPTDIDYQWYLTKCESILKEVGYYGI
jgi:hypothetical protein